MNDSKIKIIAAVIGLLVIVGAIFASCSSQADAPAGEPGSYIPSGAPPTEPAKPTEASAPSPDEIGEIKEEIAKRLTYAYDDDITSWEKSTGVSYPLSGYSLADCINRKCSQKVATVEIDVKDGSDQFVAFVFYEGAKNPAKCGGSLASEGALEFSCLAGDGG